MRGIARDVPLPPAIARDILRRADGVPLFLEELTRAVTEQIAQGGSTAGAAPRRTTERASVPVSLHASLLARLDRLGEARQVAEVASVIGREFDAALLGPVLDREADELAPMLERLVESRVLQRRGGAGGETYRFSHALIQDAALGMLPRERYRSLHARVADIIEARFPESAAAQPQVIAHHRTEAMQPEQAVAWWQRGAQQAMRRGAMEEALVQLRRGIALLQALPESPAHAQAELDMQLLAGNALLSLRGHSALETGQAYDRARHSWPSGCPASRNCATPCTASGAMPGCAARSAWPWSGPRRLLAAWPGARIAWRPGHRLERDGPFAIHPRPLRRGAGEPGARARIRRADRTRPALRPCACRRR